MRELSILIWLWPFVPVNHNILLSKFPSIWLSFTTVEWFSGYIREQTPVILFNGVESGVKMLHAKLPQELIRGLLLSQFLLMTCQRCIVHEIFCTSTCWWCDLVHSKSTDKVSDLDCSNSEFMEWFSQFKDTLFCRNKLAENLRQI